MNENKNFPKKKYCIPIGIVLFILLDSYNLEWSEVQKHTDHKEGRILSALKEGHLYHLLMTTNS